MIEHEIKYLESALLLAADCILATACVIAVGIAVAAAWKRARENRSL